ncbi:MAG: response regulator [Bacteroidia bacterium]
MENTTSTLEMPGKRDTRYAKVLLIDDNTFDYTINKKLMEVHHFAAKVDVFGKAPEALAALATARQNDLPDIIFLDITMPEMDGFEFLDEFAKLKPEVHAHCKIIMLTNSESFGDFNRANKNRFVRKLLNKPLTEQVLDAINV